MFSAVKVLSNDVSSHSYAMLYLQVIVSHARTVYCSMLKQILYCKSLLFTNKCTSDFLKNSIKIYINP